MARRSAARTPPGEGPLSRGSFGVLLQRLLPAFLLVVAVIGAPVLIFSRDGMPRLEAVESELATVEQENEALRRDIARLRAEVTRLRDDPAAVERLARDELGLIRQSEVVFQFPSQ